MTKQKLLNKIFIASMLLAVGTASLMIPTMIETAKADTSVASYSEKVSLTNSSFDATTSSYARNSVSGWSVLKNSTATTMVIDTQLNYSTHKSGTYFLSFDKDITAANSNDNKILMINSAIKTNQKDRQANEGYKSDDIPLSANAYYYFEVSMKTASFNTATEFGSIYLTGLKDQNDQEVKAAFEQETAAEWTKYYFFVATGNTSQTVNLELWLGTDTFASTGVAFFDEVYVYRYSENMFYENLFEDHSTFVAGDYVQNSTTKYLDLKQSDNLVDSTGYNFDFEEPLSIGNNLVDWKIVNPSSTPSTAHAEIVNLSAQTYFEEKTGKTYAGTDLSYDNSQALVLWTDDDGYIAVESKEIDIAAHGYYKITAYVKADLDKGSFYLNAVEQDTLFTTFPELDGSYTLHSGKSSTVSTSSGPLLTNKYEKVTLYVEGNQLYNSSLKLQLCLGDSSNKTVGYAVVDDIKVEKVSQSEYSAASDKLSFAFTSSSDASIENGMFNNISSSDWELTYPLTPEKWTIEQESKNNGAAGIINTYDAYFAEYAGYNWCKFTNPAKISGAPSSEEVSNNVFMFANLNSTYQSLSTANTLTLDAGKYYEISFDYVNTGACLTFELTNSDGILLYSDSNISTSGSWGKYSVKIFAGESTQKVTASIKYGTENNKVKGFAFVDNIEFGTSTEDAFAAGAVKADFSNFLLNLNINNSVGSTLTTHPTFNGSLVSGTYGEGGVVVGNGNTSYTDQHGNPIDENQDLPNNVLVIKVNEKSTYSLTSKFSLSVEADKYYSLKFKLLTNNLPDESTLPTVDENNNTITYNYGVTVGLKGFENAKRLASNDGFTEYTILFKSSSAEDLSFVFSLVSDIEDLYSTAYLTDIVWAESDENTYEAASIKDSYNKTLFTSTKSTETEDSDSKDSESEDAVDNSSNQNDFNWLLIPTLIMAVAVVVAIVGAVIRKIKFGKKGETKPKEKYDRKETVNKTHVKKEAKKKAEEEIKQTEEKIKSLNAELENIEKEHKDFINSSREKNNGKITKEIEHQFKVYGSKRSKIVDKLAALNEQLETLKSPEYLLKLEKKVESSSSVETKKSKK